MKHRLTLFSGLISAILSGCVADYGAPGPETANEGTGTPVAVWYATDRTYGGDAGYGGGRARISFGVADIRLPPAHVKGRLEEPALASSGMMADPRWHVYLNSVRPLSRVGFTGELRAALGESERQEILLYVHGFNTDFGRAVRRTAQIAHDMDYVGLAMTFAWPSAGSMGSYLADLNNADWAVVDLAETLRMLAHDTGAERINLVAHSMGTRILVGALEKIANGRLATDPPLFGEVIFAAPDVDSDIFAAAMPRLLPLAGHYTLYVSSNDVALSASRRLAGDHPRAGESGPGMVVIAGMDTVDASAAGGDLLGHEYFGESDPVLNDIRLLLRDGAGAAERPWLERDFHLGRSYWRLPPPATPAS